MDVFALTHKTTGYNVGGIKIPIHVVGADGRVWSIEEAGHLIISKQAQFLYNGDVVTDLAVLPEIPDGNPAPKCVDVGTWAEFEDALQNLSQSQDLIARSRLPLLFRGQGNSRWKLATTLERYDKKNMLYKDYYRLIYSSRHEIESFTGNEWAIPGYNEIDKLVQDYDQFSLALTWGPRPAYEYMIYLRHHGFPSPLLDWTRSPRVAAYFAFRNAVDDAQVSIYALAERKFKIGSNEVPDVHRLGQYVKAHQRHFLQQSDYTMCLVFNKNTEWRFSEHDNVLATDNASDGPRQNFDVWKFNIPSTERVKVLRALDEYNLNAFSLFGSEESLMETMALRKLYF